MFVLCWLRFLRCARRFGTSARFFFRLIDLSLAREPLLLAEQLHSGSDPRWSVSVLLVTLPLFLVSFWMLSTRLERSASLRHGKLYISALALPVLSAIFTIVTTIPVFLFALFSDTAILSNLLKIAAVASVYGVFLGYLIGELRRAASQ
jgi:hypothetical protein